MKKILLLCIFSAVLISCGKETEQNPFEITSNKVGYLTPETKVSQLDSIYKNDSIVYQKENKVLMASNTIEIYDKSGKKLLILEATEKENPDATLSYIQIMDPRYSTESGVSITSVFKDVKDNYPISKINNMLRTAVVFVDSIQAAFTIDKKELPAELRMGTDTKIEVSQIPDTAKIKHFMISWDKK